MPNSVFLPAAPLVDSLPLTGAAVHAAAVAWQNPTAGAVIILRAWLYASTASTGASTIDVGVTAVSAATSADSLLDGVNGNASAPYVYDSMNAALDSGANALAQICATGKWITVNQASGDTTGLVGTLFIEYVPV